MGIRTFLSVEYLRCVINVFIYFYFIDFARILLYNYGMKNDLNKILPDVINVAKNAGAAIMSFYDKEYGIKDKGKDDPVTEADIESNKIILDGLKKYGYGILSEETDDDLSRLKEKRVWIIDPLDGTKDFIGKTGDFTVMVGLAEERKTILGVVYKPIDDILYYAIKNGGAYRSIRGLEPERIHVNKEVKGKNMRMLVSRSHSTDLDARVAGHFGIKKLVLCGSIGLKGALIASGEAELNINPSERPGEYDICAADIILHEAGGKLTNMKGDRHVYNKQNPIVKNGYVASNGAVHGEIIKYINT